MENQSEKFNGGNQQFAQIMQEETIDFKKWIGKILMNWYFFAIVCMFTLGAAYITNKGVLPMSKIRATVIVEGDNSSQSAMTAMLLGTNMYGPGNYYNSMVILPSYSLIGNSLDKLDFGVDYQKKTLFKTTPYYKNAPIDVTFGEMSPMISSKAFEFEDIDGKSYNVYSEEIESKGVPEFSGVFKYGEVVGNEFFNFQVELTPVYYELKELEEDDDYSIIFTYRSKMSLQKEFKDRIQITDLIENGAVIEITMESSNAGRDIDFLNVLLDGFINRNLDRKNEQASKTIAFIKEQLETIADSLSITETKLEDFRSDNRIMDISAQATALLEQMNALDKQRAELKVQNDYYLYLRQYLEGGLDGSMVMPTTIGIQDVNLTRLVTELSEYQRLLNDLPQESPVYRITQNKFRSTKVALLETTNNILENSKISLKNIDERIEEMQRETRNLPATERQLIGIERKFKVNDAYYSFLLEKLSEAQVTKASNTSDNVILDAPMVTDSVNKNKKKINYAIALILGLFFPFVVIVANDVLDVRVRSKQDIEAITKRPILGVVLRSKRNCKVHTYEYPKTAFAEVFRSLRTRVEFMARDQKKISLMITSSAPGEGKSFVSINTAGVFGLTGKKTVLLGFDLRKPKATTYLGVRVEKGLSNFLAGKVELKDIIIRPETANFDFIPSGTIPPNPGELMSSEKMEELFSYLKEHYDVIIVDTPPTGVVSDGLWITPFVDMNLFVVRHKYTDKNLFKGVIENAEINNLKNIGVIVNDVVNSKDKMPYISRTLLGGKYGLSNNAGYGYNYGFMDSGYVEE